MEESQGSADPSAGLEDREAPAPLDVGRLGGVLCQLHRARFDGILHIRSRTRDASIGFRAGVPVTFDDPAQGHMLGDQLIERGQLTRAQCNAVIARMTDAIVEDEAVAFCEHAVQLGFLTEEAANVELSSRIRARMIQLFALSDCETNLEHGEAALFERREFPQDIGAIVYMGVRTFYDEDLLVRCHPDLSQTYVKLHAAPAMIAHFFGLDDEEFKLLRRFNPEQPVGALLEDRRVDRTHLLGLLLLLRLAEFSQVASAPFPRRSFIERPSPQSGHAAAPPHVDPEPTPSAQPSIAPDAASGAPPAFTLPVPPAPRPTATHTVDATQEALLEAAARTARMRRPPPGPLRRNSVPVDRATAQSAASASSSGQPSAVHPAEASTPPANSGAPQATQPRQDYAKAHLQELIARRKQAAAAAPEAAPKAPARDTARELREARGLLHAQQFARAEKLLAGLVETDSSNEVYKAYLLWARWRAQPEAAESLADELQQLAKKLISVDEHAAFAAYVLGHVFFHAKRDEQAEKFFKRAQTLDRNNKDAERHLLILERRKHAAAESEAAGNRKIFGIQLSGPKPKV